MIQKAINETLGSVSKGVATAVGVSNLAKQAKADEVSLQAKEAEKAKKEEAIAKETQFKARKAELGGLASQAYGVAKELRKSQGPGSRGKKSRAASYEAQARTLEFGMEALERESLSKALGQGIRKPEELSALRQSSLEDFYGRMSKQIEKLKSDLGADSESIQRSKIRKLDKERRTYGRKK